MNFEETYHRHPAMRQISRSLRMEWLLKFCLAVIFLMGGAVFGYVFFKKKNILATFGLVAILLGIKLLWDFFRRPHLENDPLWRALTRERRHIVWIYTVNTQVMPFGFHLWERGTMYFKFSDGGETTLEMPARKLKMVSKFLNKLLPHAAFGYSEERERQFQADPSKLLKT